jgi:hypothetical protein
MKTIINLLFSLLLITNASCQEARKVKVTVTEEDGTPVEGASATVIFLGYGNDGKKEKIGLTDVQGKFEARGTTSGRMHVRVEKDGYYTTNSDRLSRKKDHDVTYVLRKIKKPISLNAKRLQTLAPVIGKEFSYDCEIGDWVAPHGKGKISDLVFKAVSIRYVDRFKDYHYTLSVRFSNEADGFLKFDQNIASDMKSPYLAPTEVKYQKSWTYFKKQEPQKETETNAEPSKGYFFRLRTQVDEVGNIISCHYAKAYGDVPDLKIYFNPTPNDQNLEFDPKRNLLKGLNSEERVNEP